MDDIEKLPQRPKSSSRGGWNAAIFVIFVEMAERFAFYGLAGNLITYLTDVLHEPTATAAKNVNTWVGVSALFPLIGAFVADSYLGRFTTIILASIIYFIGMVMVTLSSLSVIPIAYQRVAFFVAIYIIAVGEGGHKPCVQTFAADQFDEDSPEEKKAKNSFFNWWYLGIVTGASLAILLVVYVQENVGWSTGYGILAAALVASFAVFLLGMNRYRKQGPLGSPFTTVAQVLVAAVRKRRVNEISHGVTRGVCYGDDEMGGIIAEPQPKMRSLARTNQFRFLDKAMIIDDIDATSKRRDPWRLCSLNQVEEVKLVVRLIPIWLSCCWFQVIQSQLHTFFTKQASTMIRSIGPHFKVPSASLQSLVGITMLIVIPVYDRIFVPVARRFTGKPAGITVLQRLGVGLFLAILNMTASALTEGKRIGVARDHNILDKPKQVVPIRVWNLLPQYILCGFSDVFGVVAMQQLFYEEMPEAMRSLGAAAYISAIGIGSFLSAGVISIVESASDKKWLGDNINRAHLDKFYWLLAGSGILNLFIFVFLAKRFVYKKVEVGGY